MSDLFENMNVMLQFLECQMGCTSRCILFFLFFFFASWQFSVPSMNCNRIYRIVFFTVVWLHRNEIVFKGNHLELLQLIDIIKVRLAYWCQGKWPSPAASVDDFFINL